MDRVSRIVLATALVLAVITGTAIVSNMSWMPAIYPTVVSYPIASTRVVVEQNDVTVPPWDLQNYQRWVSQGLPLKKGEGITIEFESTTTPTITLWSEGITLTIGREIVINGPLVETTSGNRSMVYIHTFCDAFYNGSRLFAPKECIVPETADYQVIVTNYYRYDMRVSFKVTARSTTIVGGTDAPTPSVAPYGKAETLMILWLLLGVGMVVGGASALLIRTPQKANQKN